MHIVAFVIIVLCSSIVGHAQQVDSRITLNDRISTYMPVMQPRPCSVWLTKWGASADDVKAAAKRIGLQLADSTPLFDADAMIYIYTEPDAEIYYSFSVISGTYSIFTCTMSYNEVAHAEERFDEATNDLKAHWGTDGTVTASTAQCDQTKKNVKIEVGKSARIVTFTIESTN